jgi:hypothetical protein
MSDIRKVQASIERLHGNCERDRLRKYASFTAWQLARREERSGLDPSPLLKKEDHER